MIAIIFQINPSTAFLSGLLNGLFGGWPYGVQPYGVQPSIYAIPPANNQNQQQPGQPPAYPTTNIAGAFNGLPMYNAGIGGALALPFVGIASVINSVFQAAGSILSGLGGGPFNYGALIPYGLPFSNKNSLLIINFHGGFLDHKTIPTVIIMERITEPTLKIKIIQTMNLQQMNEIYNISYVIFL